MFPICGSCGTREDDLKYFSHSWSRTSFCFLVRLLLAKLRFLSRLILIQLKMTKQGERRRRKQRQESRPFLTKWFDPLDLT